MSREDLSDRNVNLSHEELTVSKRIHEAILRGVYNLVQISKPIVSPFEEETMPLSALAVGISLSLLHRQPRRGVCQYINTHVNKIG